MAEKQLQPVTDNEGYYGQVIQNKETNDAFRELHRRLVNEVIAFCKEHDIKNAFEFWLHADGLEDSIEAGSWQPCTDSGFEIYPYDIAPREQTKPLLFSM